MASMGRDLGAIGSLWWKPNSDQSDLKLVRRRLQLIGVFNVFASADSL